MTVEIFENERAVAYDSFIETWVPNYNIVLETSYQLLKNKIGLEGEILVVGSGTGNEIRIFKAHENNWHITGVDPSADMVEIALDKLQTYRNITIIEGEVSQLISSTDFDAATLILVLHFIPDNGEKLRLLKDIAEKLKPGSPLLLVDIFGTKEEMAVKLRYLRESLPLIVLEDIEEIEARFERIYEDIQYIPEARLFELLDEAGFENPIRFHQSTLYGGWICTKKAY